MELRLSILSKYIVAELDISQSVCLGPSGSGASPLFSPLEMVFSLQEGSSGDRGAVLGCTDVYAYCSGLRCLRWYQNAGHCCGTVSEGQVPVWPRMSNSIARRTEHHILI